MHTPSPVSWIIAASSVFIGLHLAACTDQVERGGAGASPIEGEGGGGGGPRYDNISGSFSGPEPDFGLVDLGEEGAQPPSLPGLRSGDRDGDGLLDDTERKVGTDPDTPDEGCAIGVNAVEVDEETSRRGDADYIIAVDTSGSMVEELPRIAQGLDNLLSEITRIAPDAQVVLIADHNTFCPRTPNASGNECPARPVQTENFIQIDTFVDSRNSLRSILDTIDGADRHLLAPSGWGERLRPSALKAFIEISDDNAYPLNAFEFQRQLRVIDRAQGFGFFRANGESRYSFHSIVGVDAPSRGLAPDEEVDLSPCSTAPNSGPTYQQLSILTGGLRFSVCRSPNYSRIFDTISESIITREVDCTVDLDQISGAEDADYERVAVQLDTVEGSGRVLLRAQDDSCTTGDFWVDGDDATLCPDVCDVVRLNPEVTSVTAAAGCDVCIPTPERSCD